MSSPAIEARRLTKSYGRHRGILDVDLQVAAGEVMGLVGANGSGKTTFMRALLDLIRPTAGSLTVLGLDSVRDSVRVRRRTAYLPGELVLPPRLRVHEALRRYTAARTNVHPDRVQQLAERLGLDLNRRVEQLSKGNKQKVGLVLAFAPRVDLLVLDEPTSGLDPLLQREFAALVRETTGDGVTVLLSSHVMSEVEQVADRVALLREGRLAVVDTLVALHSRSRRRGRVRPLDTADTEGLITSLQALPQVSEVSHDDGVIAFACRGVVDPVLKTLATFPVAALDIAHTDLEDAFFSAYDTRSLGSP